MYVLRGPNDRTSVITVDDAVLMAVGMLDEAPDQNLSPTQRA
jgi:hypothetical protein